MSYCVCSSLTRICRTASLLYVTVLKSSVRKKREKKAADFSGWAKEQRMEVEKVFVDSL